MPERKYLTPDEVGRLLVATKQAPRYSQRNYCLVLVSYRHGLRVSEAVGLRWCDIDFKTATIYIRRLKNGKPSNQPIKGDELRALRQLQRDYPDTPWLFNSERKQPLSDRTVREIVATAGEIAGLGQLPQTVASCLRVLPCF
jgi:integrase